MSIEFVLTDAGLQAALDAQLGGVHIAVAGVAVGDAAWTPDGSATALQNERERVAIAGGTVSGGVLTLNCWLDSADGYWIREVGLFLDDGALFAVWSDAATPLQYKNSAQLGDGTLLEFQLALAQLPTGVLQVQAGSSVTLGMVEEYAKLAVTQIDGMRRDIVYMRMHGLTPTVRCPCGESGGSAPPVAVDGYQEHAIAGLTVLNVAHNLNRFPRVTLLDSLGYEITAQIRHSSRNALSISFEQAVTGTAVIH